MAIDLKAALRARQTDGENSKTRKPERGAAAPVTFSDSDEPPAEERRIITRPVRERHLERGNQLAQWNGASGPPDIHRTLPHSVEAEQGVLGSMIIDPRRAIPVARQKIDEEFFYVPAHQTVYTAACRLFADEGDFDLVTLTQYLRDRAVLDAVGGPSFVTGLFTFVPSAANITYYLEIVREKYLLRQIIATATETVRRGYEEQDEVNGLFELVTQRFEQLKGKVDFAADVNAVSLTTLASTESDPADTLLGNRFLCRRGGMLFIGPSGIGKSSASVQQDVMWSIGREAFGIRPARPLNILCIQGENDDADLGEMARGVCDGLNLTAGEREQISRRVWYVSESSRVGSEFLTSVVAPLLDRYKPDILRIDPLLAFIGADVNEQSSTSTFLRRGLNPLLAKFGCAVIVNHHSPKTTNRDTSAWRGSDWMYAGAGSADLTNWARAILVIDPTYAPRTFKWIAAKRGSRIGWSDEDGQPAIERLFSHAVGTICWHDATNEDIDQVESAKPMGSKRRPTKEALQALVPKNGAIPKNALISLARNNGIGCNAARGFISELVSSRDLFEWKIARPRTNPEIQISRVEQMLIPS